MSILRPIIIGVVLFGASFAVYENLPNQYKYGVSDWFSRLGAPNFDVPPDYFSASDQTDIIREYNSKNFKLKCFGNLRPEDKISKYDNYLCYAHINSAYDNIPAGLVAFFFSKNKLSHVRVEFPGDSFIKLQDYLGRRLANSKRLDQLASHNFGTDNFGKPLMVWAVKEGIVTTNGESTAGQNILLLWSSFDQETLRRI